MRRWLCCVCVFGVLLVSFRLLAYYDVYGRHHMHHTPLAQHIIQLHHNTNTSTHKHNNHTLPPPPPPPSPTNGSAVPLTHDLYTSGHPLPMPQLCPSLGRNISLLVLVASAPLHTEARHAIRSTWGHYAHRSDIAFAFFIGTTNNVTIQQQLSREQHLYADIVRGAFIDSYDNLTLKTLSMLEWTETYCPRAPRLLKADDDVFVNVGGVLRFVARTMPTNRTVWGRVLRRAAPARARTSKYFLPKAQWAARRLPAFATGPAYLVTGDAVSPLLSAALSSRWLRLEDVLVTGVAATKAGIARVGEPAFLNRRASPAACKLKQLLSLHMVRPHEQFELWRRLEDGRAKC